MPEARFPVTAGRIEQAILLLRGQKVILSDDLARLYSVETRVLNQAVRRNPEKFPPDFMFRLTREEAREIQRLRSQIVTLKRGRHLKYLPYAFTEHGAIMAANVLNSPRAVQMSVFVVRAFVNLRGVLSAHKDLARRLDDLERKYDAKFRVVFDAIRGLMAPPAPVGPKPKRVVGFRAGKG